MILEKNKKGGLVTLTERFAVDKRCSLSSRAWGNAEISLAVNRHALEAFGQGHWPGLCNVSVWHVCLRGL